MRLHLGQRQVTFEDLWANVIQFGKDAQGPSWQNESIVVVVYLCVCVEGVFLLTGVWEAKGRYSFEKASAEDHGPWSGPWGDVWLDHDLLRGPTVPESNDLGANFKRKKYFNPSRTRPDRQHYYTRGQQQTASDWGFKSLGQGQKVTNRTDGTSRY